MYNETAYAIPKQVEELALNRFNEKLSPLSFPKALEELSRQGKLLSECPESAKFTASMSVAEFNEYLVSIPVNVNKFMYDSKAHLPVKMEETDFFPYRNDIFSFKYLQYMDQAHHSHDYFEFMFVYKGSCALIFEDEYIVLNEGDLCLIMPNSKHAQPINPDVLCIGIAVRKSTFDKVFNRILIKDNLLAMSLKDALYGSHKSNFIRMKTIMSETFLLNLHQLVFESNQSDSYANSCASSFFNIFLNHILRNTADTIQIHNDISVKGASFDMSHVVQYMKKNYKTVTLTSLSNFFHFSDAYLSKLFVKHLNKSFSFTLREIKMKIAEDLLVNTNKKIYEVATESGYDSVDHFTRIFSSTYNMTPNKYRQEHKAK